ncbi:MAG: restriction endonuclease subunit S [Prevotella sp.]|nr:restriction endonuclease subunit S [Prevotella sp.]
MSKAEYKRLGDYIREVNVRNRELKVTNLLGVSISKEFMPSIANTIGTDMSTYKIVERGQFAYGPVTSRNGDKVSIALLEGYDNAIISQAYTVFDVKDHEHLLPEYLMMWFRRPEFDRYARFHSHGSAREIFDWDELCDVMLPIPSITRQREIVSEYKTLTNRIHLNNQMIQHLETTAQALYRKSFIDNIDKENLPEGWRMGTLTDIATYINGTACQKYETKGQDYLPVLKIRELSQGRCDENSDHVDVSIPQDYIINTGDVIFSWSATLFIDIWCGGKCALNQHLFKVTSSEFPKWFYFLWTQNHIAEWKRLISAKATSMGHIKREDLETAQVIIPSDKCLMELNEKMHPILEMYILKKQENLKLTELQSLLLAKMGQ